MVARLIVSLALVPAVTGCYDLERLDPGPKSPYLLIDDFEDGDGVPGVGGFGYWKAYPFNRAPQSPLPVAEVFEPGFESSYGLRGVFQFDPPLDHNFTGVSLGIGEARPTLDVNRYRALHVTARFDPGASHFGPTTRFYADLGCRSAPSVDNVHGAFYVTRLMDDMSIDWQSFDLFGFQEPSSEPYRIEGGPAACLAVVDSIRFTVGTNVESGQSLSGTLYIDDVYFE